MRKSATINSLTGYAASPSSASIIFCGWWTLGSVANVYMLYKEAGNHHYIRSWINFLYCHHVLHCQGQTFGPCPLKHDARAKEVEVSAKVSSLL